MRNRSISQSDICNRYGHRSVSHRFFLALACIGLTLMIPGPAARADEARADEGGGPTITPFAGIYVPTQNEWSTAEADIKRNSSFVGGAQLTWFPKSPLGLEIVGAYTPASTEIAGALCVHPV